MSCPRCFHIIGEHLLCQDHGGDSGWTAGASKLKGMAATCPSEAVYDFQHPWWDWLDNAKLEKLRNVELREVG